MATYLDVVNDVLIRLREQTVASVRSTPYSTLIGVWVNDAKREVEAAHDWSVLTDTITLATVPETSEYSLSGFRTNSKLLSVINDTEDFEMSSIDRVSLRKLQKTVDQASGVPTNYCFKGINDTTLERKVVLYPTPDAVYSIDFEVVRPQNDLYNDTDKLFVPSHLVSLLAVAKAMAERGEDSGLSSSEAFQLYRLSLADAVSIDKNYIDEETIWKAT